MEFEASLCHMVVPLCLRSVTGNYSFQWSHWSSSRPLVFSTLPSLDPHQNSSGVSYRYVLQYQSLHELQQDIDGADARVSQPKAQSWAYMLARQVRSNQGGPPFLGVVAKSVPLEACPQGMFILTYGERWGPSIPSAGPALSIILLLLHK